MKEPEDDNIDENEWEDRNGNVENGVAPKNVESNVPVVGSEKLRIITKLPSCAH